MNLIFYFSIINIALFIITTSLIKDYLFYVYNSPIRKDRLDFKIILSEDRSLLILFTLVIYLFINFQLIIINS